MERENTKTNNAQLPPQPSKKLPLEKVFGMNSLQFTEDDASSLVGSIVERGASAIPPSSAPRPSVLPFPVARHRAHAPHWVPKDGENSVTDGNEVEEFEDIDNDTTNYDPIAKFAKSLKRKKKKGLDLSNWRDFVPSNAAPNSRKKEVEQEKIEGKATETASDGSVSNGVKEDKNVDAGSPLYSVCSAPSESHNNCDLGERAHADVEVENESFNSVVGQAMLGKETPSLSRPGILGTEQDCMSLESQIDAENRALLQSMSADEVAEARAEIMRKVNPEMLEALKNRSRRKSEKQINSHSGSATSDTSGLADRQVNKPLTQDGKRSPNLDTNRASPLPTRHKMQQKEVSLNPSTSSGWLWDVWCKRVEAVRDLRFSLDGDIIETRFETEHNRGPYSATERDPLRTEGDPAAVGYTIKEALGLTRSVIPGQRVIGLHLLACVFHKAAYGICENRVGSTLRNAESEKTLVDWEAIWAFALGPQPELALSLRMLLDDNNESVVSSAVKAIHGVLGIEVNRNYFDASEKLAKHVNDLYTAPIFRSRPKINFGFVHGGFWKYSAKPSNIVAPSDGETEEEHTIKDDIALASQDIAAGLVRMEILPRLCYLLQTPPSLAVEECILSILIAVARHSPTCAQAVLKCHGLVQTIIDKFVCDKLEMISYQVKAVTLLRVLAQSSRSDCFEFTRNGTFQKITWHLHRVTYSIDDWKRHGGEQLKLASELIVEQLRFLKVCISYGYCISSFSFPAMCLWLDPPSFEKLIEKNVLHEYSSISTEVYLVLEALSRRLPSLYEGDMKSQLPDVCGDDAETWCWKDVAPMVDLGLKWLELKSDSPLCRLLDNDDEKQGYLSSLLWVASAILHMLSTVLAKATPEDSADLNKCGEFGKLLPELVTKISLQVIRNDILCFNADGPAKHQLRTNEVVSFVEKLCSFRHHADSETSLASVSCLHGVMDLIVSIDHLFQLVKSQRGHSICQEQSLPIEAIVLDGGIVNYSLDQWRGVLYEFIDLTVSEWHLVQNVAVFGRGGPAPGTGIGWGASGGGFWSPIVALAQLDATLLVSLMEVFQTSLAKDKSETENETLYLQMINSALSACLIAGPRDKDVVEKAWNILLQLPILRFLNECIYSWLDSTQVEKVFQWQYKEEDFELFSNILASHFSQRWLSAKKKKCKPKDDSDSPGVRTSKGSIKQLETIPEDKDASAVTSENHAAMALEWAHQRLPLPDHWFLSTITTFSGSKCDNLPTVSGRVDPEQDSAEFLQVAKAGLFFLFGIEAMASKFLEQYRSPVLNVSLVWKLHSLSAVLLGGIGILEDDRSKDLYQALQKLYGRCLDELRSSRNLSANEIKFGEYRNTRNTLLGFRSEIHDTYSTFLESLIEQFAAVSYGDFAYGRQLALYLHQQVEVSVRLVAWNALSNARVLDLLPPLNECIAEAEGYLRPVEEHEGILEAYTKSWVTGALDRASTRHSVAYTIALHHLSSFIFCCSCEEKLSPRDKLVKSLLRDYSRKQQREGMMLDLIRYKSISIANTGDQSKNLTLSADEITGRFELLKEVCGETKSLCDEVEKLRSSFGKSKGLK